LKLTFLLTGCQNNTNKLDGPINNTGTVEINDSTDKKAVAYWRHQEKLAMDSITSYKIDSVANLCTILLYGIYGQERIFDVERKKNITIGETDIRITKFAYQSTEKRVLWFWLFDKDSLPINSDLIFEDHGAAMFFFEVDVKAKKLVSALTGSGSKMAIEYFRDLFNSKIKSDQFRHYIDSFKVKVHPKFKMAVMSSLSVVFNK
jgi:hypothetical protein